MVKSNRYLISFLVIAGLCLAGCERLENAEKGAFDQFRKDITVENWHFRLNVENQNRQEGADTIGLSDHYLKATLYLSNSKTGKPLLYSVSDNQEDYEAKYKFLSFGCKDDLYIKFHDELIYPIGYVFEPSNGLAGDERLVYKFRVADDTYRKLRKDNEAVEYWYIERLAGLGKICFTHNN